MSDDSAQAFVFSAFLATATIAIAVVSRSPCSAEMLQQALQQHQAASCFDFWLNRYQTLLGGFFTIFAAALAALFVIKQTSVARRQLDVMLGDVLPDIYIFDPRNWPTAGFCLRVLNHNRRAIVIEGVRVFRPGDLGLTIRADAPITSSAPRLDGRGWTFRAIVEGTRPSASEVNKLELFGNFTCSGDVNTLRRVPQVTVVVDFSYLDSQRAKFQREAVMLDPWISVVSFKTESGVAAHFQHKP